MNKLLLVGPLALLFSCSTPKPNHMNKDHNLLSSAEKKEGWQLLFNGSTLDGWHTYGYDNVKSGWEVSEGTLHLNTSNKSTWPPNESRDIVTNGNYSNFHFKTDWKISPNGNSGIIFFINEDKNKYHNTYNTGLEMQVLDNNGHPDAKIIKHRAGDLYDLITSTPEMVKPAGEWNTAEIVSKDGKLDFYLNGAHVVDTHLWNEKWKEMVANSKFKTMPAFGTFKEGKIALQEHGDEVWYRNIKIRRL